MKLTTLFAIFAAMAVAATPERPLIVGIANVAVKVKDLDAARKFYAGVLGFGEAFALKPTGGAPELTCFKVNDHQYVELSPTLQTETEDRLIHVGFETTGARKLRDYLAGRGVAVPAKITPDPNGNLSFTVKDPDGIAVEFIQYMPGSVQSRNLGKAMSATRISDHIMHVGVHALNEAVSDRFYKDILGFRPLWKGGATEERVDWASLMVPDGGDWVEYMLSNPHPNVRQLGSMHHFCLQFADEQAIQQSVKTVVERGYQDMKAPFIGRDGRWLANLYDPDFTRAEIMVRKPVRTPCCSPNSDDH